MTPRPGVKQRHAIKIDKPLVVYIFTGNVMVSISALRT